MHTNAGDFIRMTKYWVMLVLMLMLNYRGPDIAMNISILEAQASD